MLRLPEIGSHATYQQLLSQLIGHKHLKKKKRKLVAKLLNLDLSPVDEIMRPFLFRGGPSCMVAFLNASFLSPIHLV